MSDSLLAGVYWGARHESPTECAQRASTFFRLVALCGVEFSHWYETADTLEEALSRPFKTDQPTLRRLLADADEQNEFGWGFMLSAWTGQTETEPIGRGAGVSITCGAISGAALPNRCEARLARGIQPEKMGPNRLPMLIEIMAALVVAWEPEWGIVIDERTRRTFVEAATGEQHVGWLTYVNARREDIPELPEVFRVESVSNLGTLIILTETPLTADHAEGMELARQVQRKLQTSRRFDPA